MPAHCAACSVVGICCMCRYEAETLQDGMFVAVPQVHSPYSSHDRSTRVIKYLLSGVTTKFRKILSSKRPSFLCCGMKTPMQASY